MRLFSPDDDVALSLALKKQKKLAWNLEKSILWKRGIDFSKPLVPLDEFNIMFPGPISPAQKLVISQFMGLLMAATFSETEKALGRLRTEAWESLMQNSATHPEIIQLGEQFFAEEDKHSRAFDRYIDLFAKGLGVDSAVLRSLLPSVNSGWIESRLRRNAEKGGLILWWIVATVEEESTMIFRQMIPFRKVLDPLYYELHKRHFEEEARHMPYAFMILDMCLDRGPFCYQSRMSLDFMRSEWLKMIWLAMELGKTLRVRQLKEIHPFFAELSALLGNFKMRHIPVILYRFLRRTPYISPFINAQYHEQLSQHLKTYHCPRLPLPSPQPDPIGW